MKRKTLSNITKPLTLTMAAVCLCTMLASCGKTQTENPNDSEATRDEYKKYREWAYGNPLLDENKNFTITTVAYLDDNYVSNCCKGANYVTVSEKITDDEVVIKAKSDTIIEYRVDENNERYVAVDGVIFTKDMKTLVLFPVMRRGEYKIPEGTETIGKRAFAECMIEKVEIPDSVKTIGDNAFSKCKLKELKYPAGVTSMGTGVFSDLRDTVIEIPEGVEFLPREVFANCNLKEINIPSSVRTIGYRAFGDAHVGGVIYIPDEVENIEDAAFAISDGTVSIPADFKWDNYVSDSCIFKVVYVGGIDMSYDDGVFESGQRVDPHLGIIYRGTRAQWNKLEISINTSEKQVRCSDEKAK